MKKFLTLTLAILLFFKLSAQTDSSSHTTSLIRWMSLEEAEAQNKQFPKAVMVFVMTDWCGWCKHMMSTTFSNPAIAAYINVNFYPVLFNGESRDTIIFQDSIFVNPSQQNRSPHNLTKMLLNGKLSYPTTVFYNNQWQFKLIIPGYHSVTDYEPFLVYTTEYVFKTTNVEPFVEAYHKATKADSVYEGVTPLDWLSIEEAVYKQKTQPKKIMVLLNTSWCNSGRVMKNSTFRDSLIVNITNELFYPVYFDAESKDTVIFKGITFVNDGSMGTFHNFAVSLCNGRIVLPSIVYIDTNFDLIAAVPQYYGPDDMEMILHYFGGTYYKTQTWEDYRKTFVPARNKKSEHNFEFGQ